MAIFNSHVKLPEGSSTMFAINQFIEDFPAAATLKHVETRWNTSHDKISPQAAKWRPGRVLALVRSGSWCSEMGIIYGYTLCSYGHLPVISGYKWDYTFYKWGYKYL